MGAPLVKTEKSSFLVLAAVPVNTLVMVMTLLTKSPEVVSIDKVDLL